jgi:hypothetical protein
MKSNVHFSLIAVGMILYVVDIQVVSGYLVMLLVEFQTFPK